MVQNHYGECMYSTPFFHPKTLSWSTLHRFLLQDNTLWLCILIGDNAAQRCSAMVGLDEVQCYMLESWFCCFFLQKSFEILTNLLAMEDAGRSLHTMFRHDKPPQLWLISMRAIPFPAKDISAEVWKIKLSLQILFKT